MKYRLKKDAKFMVRNESGKLIPAIPGTLHELNEVQAVSFRDKFELPEVHPESTLEIVQPETTEDDPADADDQTEGE